MPRFDNPCVLVTRPQAASDRFVEALKATAGPFQSLICPAFETIPLVSNADIPTFDVAVFTSQAGVAYAPAGLQRTAYCVGSVTAQAAKAAGYKAVDAGGNVNDLIKVILADAPKQTLVHLRGQVSIGNVSSGLTSGGLTCVDVVTYRKQPVSPKPEVMASVGVSPNLILPVFSSETVSIIADWDLDFSAAHAVAISLAVAEVIENLTPLTTTVSSRSDMRSMVAATASLIA